MEVVIIQGGVAQDTSKGVHVIDLDNLAEETEIAVLAATRDTARGAGMTWVVEEIDTFLVKRFLAERAAGATEEEMQSLADEYGIYFMPGMPL